MRKRSTMRARVIGGALASAALVFTLLLPGSAFALDDLGGGLKIGVDRNCTQVDGSLGNCIYQTANPSARIGDIEQESGDTFNVAAPDQEVEQHQHATQLGAAAVVSVAGIEKIDSQPRIEVKSGEVDVEGNKLILNLWTPQVATASPKVEGDLRQTINTGSSDTTTTQSGDTVSAGGFAGAYQSSSNKIEAEADQKANNGTDVFSIAGDSGKAYAGDSGDIEGGKASGGFNLAFAANGNDAEGGDATGGYADDAVNVAAAVAASVAVSDDDSATAGNSTATSNPGQDADSKGGSALAALLAGSKQYQSANGGSADANGSSGAGGAATTGAGGAGGTATYTPSANQNVLTGNNTQNATGTATGGNASSGDAFGHSVVGGVSGNNQNLVSMNGGQAINSLTVTPSVSGTVTGYSGGVSNTGSATSTVTTTFNQGGTATNNQTQNPSQSGTNNSTIGNQNATGGTQTADPNQNVNSGPQNATASNSKTTSIKAEVEDNFNEIPVWPR